DRGHRLVHVAVLEVNVGQAKASLDETYAGLSDQRIYSEPNELVTERLPHAIPIHLQVVVPLHHHQTVNALYPGSQGTHETWMTIDHSIELPDRFVLVCAKAERFLGFNNVLLENRGCPCHFQGLQPLAPDLEARR